VIIVIVPTISNNRLKIPAGFGIAERKEVEILSLYLKLIDCNLKTWELGKAIEMRISGAEE